MSGGVPIITVDDDSCAAASPISVIILDENNEEPSQAPVITIEDKESNHTVENDKKRKAENIPDIEKRPRKHDVPMHDGLLEEDVGITQFMNAVPGFEAVIKQRYSDFHVNEVDLHGNVAKLTSLEVPKEEEIIDEAVDKNTILSVISEEQLNSLEDIIATADKKKSVLIDVTSLSKDERKNVHQLLKSVFKSKVYSNTVDKGESKFIEVGLNSKIDDRFDRQKWIGGQYLHFILHKENMDHTQTVNLFSQMLKLKSNFIGAAGNKDKRAKTTQWMSIRRVKADRISKLKLRNIWCGHYCYKKEPLKLGDLKGNVFRIALRNVTVENEVINQAMNAIGKNGFLNYYGLQRFGSSIVAPTHIIGKTLLQGKWKEAIELILKPRPKERGYHEMNKAREVWWNTRDAHKAVKCLRNPLKSIEGKLLLAFDQLGPTAYINALEKLPRTTALLYVHSYQSYVWNRIVSKRVEKFGLSPIVGDLIVANDVDVDFACNKEEFLSEDALDPESEVTEESRLLIDKKSHSFIDKSKLNSADNTLPNDKKSEVVDVEDKQETSDSKSRKINVKTLKEEDLPNYCLGDIIYPLPGYNIEYPDNIIKEWYKEILAEDNLTSQSLKQSIKLFSTPGSYRKISCVPKDLSWKVVKYKNDNDCLILSDIEKINGSQNLEISEDGAYKGVTLEISLPSCSYATMCIREITKSSTSVSYQASLSSKSSEGVLSS